MFIEYFSADEVHGPVILLGDVSPSDATLLFNALGSLASGSAKKVAVDELPGLTRGSQLVTFEAHATDWDGGCRVVPATTGRFQCALKPGTWDQVASLIAPFAKPRDGHRHQYLSEEGPVTWIVSTDGAW